MSHRTVVPHVCATMLIGALGSGVAFAQGHEKRITVAFSEAVAVPGATLAPGTYLFRMDTDQRGEIVHVSSVDGRTPHATFFAVRVARQNPESYAVISFNETATPRLRQITSVWYPGGGGYDFVYPPVPVIPPLEDESLDESLDLDPNTLCLPAP